VVDTQVWGCVGDEESLTNSLRWTRAGGTVMIVGLHMSPMKNIDLATARGELSADDDGEG